MKKNLWRAEDFEHIQDNEEFFRALVQKALTEENSTFEFIRSWSARKVIKNYIAGAMAIIKVFDTLYKTIYKQYVKQIKTNTQDLQTLLTMKQFSQCLDYYVTEVNTASEMLEEYWAYVCSGHVIDTLMGKPRTEDELFDHRGRWV